MKYQRRRCRQAARSTPYPLYPHKRRERLPPRAETQRGGGHNNHPQQTNFLRGGHGSTPQPPRAERQRGGGHNNHPRNEQISFAADMVRPRSASISHVSFIFQVFPTKNELNSAHAERNAGQARCHIGPHTSAACPAKAPRPLSCSFSNDGGKAAPPPLRRPRQSIAPRPTTKTISSTPLCPLAHNILLTDRHQKQKGKAPASPPPCRPTRTPPARRSAPPP